MPRSVSLLAGSYNVELANGVTYSATYPSVTAGPTVILTDEEWALTDPASVGAVLQDNGNIGTSVVSVQAAHVANVAAVTTADAAAATAADPTQSATAVTAGSGANGYDTAPHAANIVTQLNATITDVAGLVTQVDALITDVASIRTEFNKAVTDITALYTTLHAELVALQVANGPQASS